MSKNILSEITRMKDLFGYKKGVVISEQTTLTQKQKDAMNAGYGPLTDEAAKNLPVDANGKIIPKKVDTTTSSANTPTTQASTTTQPKTLKNVTVYAIPKSLKDKEGVKKFQDWLDSKAPGWLKKYGTINADLKKGYGKFGPSTSAAWEKYKDTYFSSKLDYKVPAQTDADAPVEDDTAKSTANTGGYGVPTEDGGETYAPTVEKDDF